MTQPQLKSVLLEFGLPTQGKSCTVLELIRLCRNAVHNVDTKQVTTFKQEKRREPQYSIASSNQLIQILQNIFYSLKKPLINIFESCCED